MTTDTQPQELFNDMQLLCYPIYLRLLLQATYANPAENPTHSNPSPKHTACLLLLI